MLQHYKNQACPELGELIQEDAITYSVLLKILRDSCCDILTDHRNVVVCYSNPPYPVWVWCRDVGDDGAVMEIAHCLKEQLPLNTVRYCIMSEALLQKLREADLFFRDTKPGWVCCPTALTGSFRWRTPVMAEWVLWVKVRFPDF